MRAPDRGRPRAAAAGAALLLALAVAAARAAENAADWSRDGSAAACASANHQALGRLLVVIHAGSETAKDSPAAIAADFLERSPLEWIVALRNCAYLVRELAPRFKEKPYLEVIETDGSVVASVPLTGGTEETAEKLKGRIYLRARVAADARFRKPDRPEFEIAAPPGYSLTDVGRLEGGECVLLGPNDQQVFLGTVAYEGDLAGAEERVRADLEKGYGARNLSAAQHAKATRPSGKIKAIFETEGGEKGAAVFDLVKQRGLYGAVVIGSGATEKVAEALLAHLKQGAKRK